MCVEEGGGGKFAIVENWPFIRVGPTGMIVINTVLFPCMRDNGRKVHITGTYHRRKLFLNDLKHY